MLRAIFIALASRMKQSYSRTGPADAPFHRLANYHHDCYRSDMRRGVLLEAMVDHSIRRWIRTCRHGSSYPACRGCSDDRVGFAADRHDGRPGADQRRLPGSTSNLL